MVAVSSSGLLVGLSQEPSRHSVAKWQGHDSHLRNTGTCHDSHKTTSAATCYSVLPATTRRFVRPPRVNPRFCRQRLRVGCAYERGTRSGCGRSRNESHSRPMHGRERAVPADTSFHEEFDLPDGATIRQEHVHVWFDVHARARSIAVVNCSHFHGHFVPDDFYWAAAGCQRRCEFRVAPGGRADGRR
jgi:hypothetical protein